MSREDRVQVLNELHDQLVNELLAKIKKGTATASDLKLAWDLLKDNGVILEDLKTIGEEPPLSKSLPFRDVDDPVVGKVGVA